ncbi:MAG: hypothetical protein IIV08_06830 [Selenomonadales bacterium]|nr:hypothetical protein [Selenomonadales bacterium]
MNVVRNISVIMIGTMFALGVGCRTVTAEEVCLEKNTHFYLQGHTVGEEVEFRKETVVVLNDIGEVVEGVLNEEAYLRPVGWQSIIQDYSYAAAYLDARPFFPRMASSGHQAVMMTFGHLPYKEKTKIVLDEDGYVLSGTVKDDVTIALVEERYGFVTLKGDNELAFYPDGKLKSGVLKEDTNLRPVGWQKRLTPDTSSAGYVMFRAGEDVVFDENGEVIVGTIKEALPTLTDKDGKMYLAGTKLSFTADGVTEMAKAVDIPKPLKMGFE